ncbi:amidophosphoribosyltransferase [Sediminispirochaeta bajacaliforniensis]|uniref:amidophosphoribosyltransferase n=1 Tax=Sediminispirochaeta bajacaliforniensis TaxID=148 RepID=UPI0003620711|nr:amidophosphoribosyltransferase [Sediminispirochaeta bajacaliforniensis]
MNSLFASAEAADDKLHEECGVFAVCAKKDFAPSVDPVHVVLGGLTALQHRGQESSGIILGGFEDPARIEVAKSAGLVASLIDSGEVLKLDREGSTVALGHVRYSTTGGSGVENAQPLVAHTKKGAVALAHNGNLVNSQLLRELLEEGGSVFRTQSDSEVMLNLIARSLAKKSALEAVRDAVRTVQGSYALAVLADGKLIAARDKNGIRPLCVGELEEYWVVSSETCALDAIGAKFLRDVEPGEIIVADGEGIAGSNQEEKTETRTCSFEYIYFARPDSVIDGIGVYGARVRSGRQLFKEAPVKADLVTGVPDSGIPAAAGFSEASGIPYGMSLVKNRYVGRSFIAPSQDDRERRVALKHNALKEAVKGMRIVLIDDSIVRGTTMRSLVSKLKGAGATEVHIRIAAPPVAFPCYFGIDTPYREDLVSNKYDIEELARRVGADSLAFLSVEGLVQALSGTMGFCTGCFTGVYPMGAPKPGRED